MYRNLTKLSLARVASVAVVIVALASMTGPANADHDDSHVDDLKGRIGDIERKIWDCENKFIGGACTKAAVETRCGPDKLLNSDGICVTLPVNTDTLGSLSATCTEGQTVTINASGVWECADVGAGGSQELIDNLKFLLEVNASAYVFVTSETYTGNLVQAANDEGLGPFGLSDGIAAANALCQERADAADLPGWYSAWIGNELEGPLTTFSKFITAGDHPFSPYVLTNGLRVADTFADLTDGLLANAISTDEFGDLVPAPLRAWTGTRPSGSETDPIFAFLFACSTDFGTPAHAWTTEGSDCINLRSPFPICGMDGNTSATNTEWTETVDLAGNQAEVVGALSDCSELKRLYCFGQSEALLAAP